MKKNLIYILFLVLTSNLNAQTQFWSDNFEDAGSPSIGSRSASVEYHSSQASGYFTRTASPLTGTNGTYSNFSGSKFWAGEDLDRTGAGQNQQSTRQTITWGSINISGKTNITFKGLFAAWNGSVPNAVIWDGPTVSATDYDFLEVEYSIDGGAYTSLITFAASNISVGSGMLVVDANHDYVGDVGGTALGIAFSEFTGNISGTGTTLTLRFKAGSNSPAEEFAIDNFRLFASSGSPLSASISSQTNVPCNGGSTGSATVSVTGGTAPYSYSWSPSGGSSSTASNLSAGSYTVTVTDATSATTTASVTITQATAISLTAASQTNVACNGGSTGAASVNSATGGAGSYSYNWTPGNPTGDGTTSISGLTANTWTCTVTDANGCTAARNFTITQPTALSLTAASQTNVACYGGSTGAASVNAATGGAIGYSYNWTPGNPTGDGTVSVTGLIAGTWTCTVTDANGCTSARNFTLTEPSVLAASTNSTNVSSLGGNDGTASVTPSGGTTPYTYSWSPSGGSSSSASSLTAGSYTCTITDANSCTLNKSFTITQPSSSPTITTTTASSINSISATSGGSISSDGGSSITAKGVCWSTSVNPTISDSTTSDGTGSTSFTSTITGLLPNTTYHYRAYATNSIGTSYGSDLTFTTSALPTATEEWNPILKVVASDRAAGDNYGFNIAISGDYAVVGAPLVDTDESGANSMSNAGAAYILKQTNGIWTQVQKIVNSDRATGDNFGYRVAIDGNYIVVGAWAEDEDENGANTLGGAGSVYVFKNNAGTWSQIKKMVASDRRTADNFGIAVAISGEYIAVGAHLQDFDINNTNQVNSAGSVYLYKNNSDTWNQVQKLVAPDRSWQDYFGASLSISGDYLAIGARQEGTESFMSSSSPSFLLPNNVDKNTCHGAVYLYKNVSSTWTYMEKITAPLRTALDLFGWSVSLSGSTLVVGAPGEDEDMFETNTLADAGAAYVFQNYSDSWKFIQKLVSNDRSANDILGRDVSTDASHIIIGSFQEDEDASNSNSLTDAGSAYIFKNVSGAWVQTKKIVASDRATQDDFGFRVALSGNYLISTAYLEDDDVLGTNALSGAGSIYTFSLVPIVSSVSVPTNGNYSSGQSLNFTVNFYGNVTVTGTPRVELTIGSSVVYANYASGSGTSALIFTYTIQSGDVDSDGISVGAMSLNGGTITANSNSAILTLNNVGSTTGVLIVSGPSTYVSSATGPWTTSGTWISNSVPSSSDNAQINNGHNVTVSGNTSITNLILKSGSTLTVTGTAVLTITGYLQDEGGSFSIATGAQVIVNGTVKNNTNASKILNSSTNGLLIKGNVDVEQGTFD